MSPLALLAQAAPAATAAVDPMTRIADELTKLTAAVQLMGAVMWVLLGAGGLTVMSVYAAVAMPRRTRRARELCERRPMLCLLVGCTNLLGMLILSGVLGAAPLLAMIVLLTLALGLFGAAHVKAAHIGHRLSDALDQGGSPPFDCALGMLALTAHALVPIVGWLIGSYQLLVGLGAVVITQVTRAAPLDDVDAPETAGAPYAGGPRALPIDELIDERDVG